MYLLINTTSQNQIEIYLQKGKKIYHEALKGDYKVSERLLFVIEKIFKKNKFTFKSLKGIIVINGIGSFTGLRIAISVANTLGYIYNAPVVDYIAIKDEEINIPVVFDKKIKELSKLGQQHLILPVYERDANITIAK